MKRLVFAAALMAAMSCSRNRADWLGNAVLVDASDGARLVVAEYRELEAKDNWEPVEMELAVLDPRNGRQMGTDHLHKGLDERYSELSATRGSEMWLLTSANTSFGARCFLKRVGAPYRYCSDLASDYPELSWSKLSVQPNGVALVSDRHEGFSEVDIASGTVTPRPDVTYLPWIDPPSTRMRMTVLWAFEGGYIVRVGRSFTSVAADGTTRWHIER